MFERQVEGLAVMGDAVVGITTSGRSENVHARLLSREGQRRRYDCAMRKHGLTDADADHAVRKC